METNEFQCYLLKSLKNKKKNFFPNISGYIKNHNPIFSLQGGPNKMHSRFTFPLDSYFLFPSGKN